MAGVIGHWTFTILVVANSGHIWQYKPLTWSNLRGKLHRCKSGRVEHWHIIYKVFGMNWFGKSSQNQIKWKMDHQSEIAKTKLDVLAGVKLLPGGSKWSKLAKNMMLWSSRMLTATCALIASCRSCWQKGSNLWKRMRKKSCKALESNGEMEKQRTNSIPENWVSHMASPQKMGGCLGNPMENGWSSTKGHVQQNMSITSTSPIRSIDCWCQRLRDISDTVNYSYDNIHYGECICHIHKWILKYVWY